MTDEAMMMRAIAQARRAGALGDVPIGAVIARGGEVVAEAGNRRIVDRDPTAHAEMLAIRAAADRLGDWRLVDCTLAVTLEPCCMCAGAIVLARIPRLVYGAADPKGGAVETLYRLCTDDRLNHRVEVVSGVQAATCGGLLTDFFRAQRAKGRK
jgi:tRNA(adenine34) deaminase